jgi:hypothetical protein
MIELEIYAPGVRQMDKILALEMEFSAVHGLRYRVDNNHDMVSMEFEIPCVSIEHIRAMFHRCDLQPRVVGAIPAELNSRSKTQRLVP